MMRRRMVRWPVMRRRVVRWLVMRRFMVRRREATDRKPVGWPSARRRMSVISLAMLGWASVVSLPVMGKLGKVRLLKMGFLERWLWETIPLLFLQFVVLTTELLVHLVGSVANLSRNSRNNTFQTVA
jgi:hypothetical protein